MSFSVTYNQITSTISDSQLHGLMGRFQEKAIQLNKWDSFLNYFAKLINRHFSTDYFFDKKEFLQKIYHDINPPLSENRTVFEVWSAMTSLFSMMEKKDWQKFEFRFYQEPMRLVINHGATKVTELAFDNTEENIKALLFIRENFTNVSLDNTHYVLKNTVDFNHQLEECKKEIYPDAQLMNDLARLKSQIDQITIIAKWQDAEIVDLQYDIDTQLKNLTMYLRLHQELSAINGKIKTELDREAVSHFYETTPLLLDFLEFCTAQNNHTVARFGEYLLEDFHSQHGGLEYTQKKIESRKEKIHSLLKGWQPNIPEDIVVDKNVNTSLIGSHEKGIIPLIETTYDIISELISASGDKTLSAHNKVKNAQQQLKQLAPTNNESDPRNSTIYAPYREAASLYAKKLEGRLFADAEKVVIDCINKVEKYLSNYDIQNKDEYNSIVSQMRIIEQQLEVHPEMLDLSSRGELVSRHGKLISEYGKYYSLKTSLSLTMQNASDIIHGQNDYNEQVMSEVLRVFNDIITLSGNANRILQAYIKTLIAELIPIRDFERELAKFNGVAAQIESSDSFDQKINNLFSALCENLSSAIKSIKKVKKSEIKEHYQAVLDEDVGRSANMIARLYAESEQLNTGRKKIKQQIEKLINIAGKNGNGDIVNKLKNIKKPSNTVGNLGGFISYLPKDAAPKVNSESHEMIM